MSSVPVFCPVVLDLPELTIRSITEILSNVANLEDPNTFVIENLRAYVYKYIHQGKGFPVDLNNFAILPIEAEQEDLNITDVIRLDSAANLSQLSLSNNILHYSSLPNDIIGPEQDFVISFSRLSYKFQGQLKKLIVKQLGEHYVTDLNESLHRIAVNSMVSRHIIEDSIIDMSKFLPVKGNSFDLVHIIKIPKNILKRELLLEDFRAIFLEHGKHLSERRNQFVNSLIEYVISDGFGGNINSPEFVEKVKDTIEEKKAFYQGLLETLKEHIQHLLGDESETSNPKEKFMELIKELSSSDPYVSALLGNIKEVTDEDIQDFVNYLSNKVDRLIEDFNNLSTICNTSDAKKIITKLSSPLIDDMLSRIAVQMYLFNGLNYPYIACLDVNTEKESFYLLVLIYGMVELSSWVANIFEKNHIFLKAGLEYGFRWKDVRTVYSISNIHPLDYFLMYETLLVWANLYRARKKRKWLRSIPHGYHKLFAAKKLLVKMVLTDILDKHCPIDFRSVYKALESNSILIAEKYHLQENKRQSVIIPYVNTSLNFTRHLFEKKRNPNYPSYQAEKKENPEVINNFLAIDYEKYLDCQANVLSVLLPYHTVSVLEKICASPGDWILSKYYDSKQFGDFRKLVRHILNESKISKCGFIRVGYVANALHADSLFKTPCYEWLIREYRRLFREMFRPSRIKDSCFGKLTKEYIPYAFAETLHSLVLSNPNFIWIPAIYPYYPLVLAVLQNSVTETNIGKITNIIDCPEAFDVVDLVTEEILNKYGAETPIKKVNISDDTKIFSRIFSTGTKVSEEEIKEFAELFFSLPICKVKWFVENCLKAALDDCHLIITPLLKAMDAVNWTDPPK
jgi:hypothetical protein